MKEMNDIEDFKEKVKPPTVPPPTYYFIGDRSIQILHTRLRVGNADLKVQSVYENLVRD